MGAFSSAFSSAFDVGLSSSVGASSQKLTSQGTTFDVLDTGQSPEEWITVGGVRAINDLRSGTAVEIDVTDLQSTEKEFLLGNADPGSMGVDLWYDPEDAGQIILETLRETSDQNSFRVTIPNPLSSPQITTFTFGGYVSQFPFSVGVDTAIGGTVAIRLSGPITKG